MDIFKGKRSHTQGGSKHITNSQHTTTKQERTQEIAPFLFVHIDRKGKGNNNPTKQTNQPTKPKKQQSKQGRKPSREAGQEKKTKGQKDKKQGKHAASHITAKHLTHIKAPQATQSTRAIQTHTTTLKPAENPLKKPNRAIFKCNAPKAKRESGQKAGTKGRNTYRRTPEAPAPCTLHHLHPVDTTTAPKREPQRKLYNPQN